VPSRGGFSTSFLRRGQYRGVSKEGRSQEKLAVFDIKPTYKHLIFIPGVRLHPPEITIGGQTVDWGRAPSPQNCP